MKSFRVISCIIFCCLKLNATVFTVTSNANAGAGSLREAIQLANADRSSLPNQIRFNLLGNTLTDVTIALESELPILKSDLIIDGTTQPNNLLQNANIRISLIRVVADYFHGLRMDNAQNIQVYGISFSNFKADPAGTLDEKKGGIYLLNSSNIIIGAIDKPNCFVGNYAGIIGPFVIPSKDLENIKISANIFGLSENGLVAEPNDTGIDLSFLKNSVIGGDSPLEGNLLTSNTNNGMALGGTSKGVIIKSNVIGLDKTLSKTIPSFSAKGIYINGVSSDTKVANNIVCAQNIGIHVDYTNGGFVVSANRIGTSVNGNESFGNNIGIHINNCDKGLIGGGSITDENKIAYNKQGVLIELSYPISILKNSFYCNANSAVSFKSILDPKTITPSRISTITASGASGVYLPNAVVELFYTDSCPDCQGKTWIATLTTDPSGAWSYSGPIAGPITSMGTNADGATSNFSKPIIDDSKVTTLGVFCGRTNGSVTNIDVFDASVYNWYNESGVLVGTDKDLLNVGNGKYQLKTGQLGACDLVSRFYTIDAASNGINDANKIIIDTFCGSSKGSITNIGIADDLSRTWYNADNEVVGTNADLLDVPAGNYYFKAGLENCVITSKTYTVNNIIHQYKVANVSIKPATCGNANGNINIIGYETQKPDTFEWFDENGNLISTNENVVNLPAGIYSLLAKGRNGCANKVGDFEVPIAALPIVDYSKFAQYLSCDGKFVSTTGITINGNVGPYTYEWLNDAGDVVSNELNLNSVTPGILRLKVTDRNGCTVMGSTFDFTSLAATALKIPNSFSPNDDQINDHWQINGADNYPNADFMIFSRNGTQVFQSKGYAKPFDGKFNGKFLPTGVYYYVIDLKSACGKLTGSLTIIR
ncbi:gliding motility-associated C-terminal domain-containing protein [Pedobacter namyangjuensis]|uniref:gliding motility-associated C-terminal domain-containing protein n=1 Tax=Pedobacter namyangjuensis TaxID=600626 RepID=UPI000DE2413B|nr:gliding motility-associated C-terminal domain-containing protein [Pedobacter namyangjuensis]